MRDMYDSVNANAIPQNAPMVAGYVDGIFKWSQANWNRFPNAIKIRISAIGATTDAEVFDVEVGCIWPPSNVVPLVVAARAKGIIPTVYVNRQNDWQHTAAEFHYAGVPEPLWWVAEYNGVREVPAGSIGKQHSHPNDKDYNGVRPLRKWETGQHFDLSSMVDFWPGVDSTVDGGDEFLMGLPQWQQERIFERVLSMSAGVAGQNFDGPQFADERAQVVAIRESLANITGVLVALANDDTNNVVLTDEQLAALQASTSATVDDAVADHLSGFELGVERILEQLAAVDANDVDQAEEAIRRAFGRAAAKPPVPPTEGG